jgi:hypothetical protein
LGFGLRMDSTRLTTTLILKINLPPRNKLHSLLRCTFGHATKLDGNDSLEGHHVARCRAEDLGMGEGRVAWGLGSRVPGQGFRV